MADLVFGSFVVALMPVPLGLTLRLIADAGAWLAGLGASAED